MDVENLIGYVKKYPFLFDVTHKDYKNVNLKTDVWQSIGKEMKLNDDIVKAKWKSLRDGYSKYKKQVKEATPSGKRVPEYVWRCQLSFLDNYNSTRKRRSNLFKITSPTGAESPSQDSDHLQAFTPTQSNQSPLPSTTPQDAAPTSKLPIYLYQQVQNHQNTIEGDHDNPLEGYGKRMKIDHDGIDHLFLSYAETFKRFPPREQVLLKLELAKLFTNTELNLLGSGDTSEYKYEFC